MAQVMPPHKELEFLLSSFSVVLGTAAFWCASNIVNMYLMSFSNFATGIDLVYLPAGVRLVIVMMFGIWGAVGIFLANPILYEMQFGASSTIDVIVNSLICGFAPFFTVKIFCRLAGIDVAIQQLRAIHFPLLALAVSIVTPVLLNLYFIAAGMKNTTGFLANVTAMVTGDFLGCFLLIVLVRIVILVWRVRSN